METLRKVLLVEDNRDDETLILRAIKKANPKQEIEVVRDGAEALDWLYARGQHEHRDASQLPKLVILDLKLPKLDGFQVLEAIRKDQRTRFLPVVVLTSSAETSDVERCYELGANAYAVKPVSFTELNEVVGRIADFWFSVCHVPLWKEKDNTWEGEQ